MAAEPIYLDHHATTPLDARVLEAMLPYLTAVFGNAASRSHVYGKRARDAVEQARAEVAALLGANPSEVVFTSGATEADNLALSGVLGAAKGRHVVTQATEHRAVLDTCAALERRGVRVHRLPVDAGGRVEPGAVGEAIEEDTALVSIMLSNNEIGTVQEVGAIGEQARARGVLFHCDAAQGLGYVPLDVREVPVDLVSLSGHKIYGPKGVGALYVRSGARDRLTPCTHGGGHEGGLRPGTLNVPGIVGLGRAATLMREHGEQEAERLARLRDRLYHGLLAKVPEVHLNGPPLAPGLRHPGNLSVRFLHLDAGGLLLDLWEQLAASTGSACSSENPAPSHVLRAIGLDADEAKSTLRLGLGRTTTESEVDRTVDLLARAAAARRERSPLWALHARGESTEDIDW